MTTARSYLYVPGDQPARLEKAFTRGAEALIVDLEDAVAAGAKDEARDIVVTWLSTLDDPPVPIWVRVNPGALREADVRAVATQPALAGIVVAKTEEARELDELDRLLTSLSSAASLSPLVESARGVLAVAAIAAAPRVGSVQIGEVDLAADLRLTVSDDERELLAIRSQVVVASRAAGIDAPIAPVSVNFTDPERYRRSCEDLRRAGFHGRACIHPAQVTIANDVYAPTAEEIRWAEGVVALLGPDVQGVAVDAAGNMIDEAVARRARDILASARN